MGPFELLELSPTDDMNQIRDAYHRIAGTRHPDLFRGKLPDGEAETLMRLFARVTGAYAALRDPETRKKLGAKPARPTPPGGGPPVAKPGDTPTGLRKISPRALSHVRRAEAMLKTGDLASAILHLRMAVAAEPNVQELRQMLRETEAQLKK
jgi:curved DNA-binding protein CbpA